MASPSAKPRPTEETETLQLPKTPPRVLLRAHSANSLSDSPPTSSHSRTRNPSTTTLVPSLTIPLSPNTTPASTATFFTTFPSPTASTSEITAWLQTWFEINYSFLDHTSSPNITDYLTRFSLSISELTSLSESELHQVLARNTSGLGANCVQAVGRLAGDIVKAREITASSSLSDKERKEEEEKEEKDKKEGEENNDEVRFFLSVSQKGQWGKVRGDKGWINDSGQWGIEETFSEKIKNGIKEKVSGVKHKFGEVLGKAGVVLKMGKEGKKEEKEESFGIEANRSAGVEREKNTCSEGSGGWKEEGW